MWNYRIIKTEIKGQPDQYGLFEVIYNDDKEISAHTERAEIVGESPEEIVQTLRLMLNDANKSYYNVLNYKEIKFAPLYDENEKSEVITLDEL
jgi:hypothetical protein